MSQFRGKATFSLRSQEMSKKLRVGGGLSDCARCDVLAGCPDSGAVLIRWGLKSVAGLWRRQFTMVVSKVRQDPALRRKAGAGGRILSRTDRVSVPVGGVVGRFETTGLSLEILSVAKRMTRWFAWRGGWFACGSLSDLQEKDEGRRSLFSVSSCRNRKTREEAPNRRLVRSKAECWRFGGESGFSKVIELDFSPQNKTALLLILASQ